MKKAFTLIELSIVLTIIALIVGGVTVASGIIKTARLKSVASDFNQYEAAVNNFRLKYNALPGDMTNASSFWTTCDATPSNCNGNGDGYITLSTTVSTNESYRAWQQMSAAYLINGSFSGTGGTGYQAVIGTNVPASKWVTNSGYFFDNYSTSPVTLTWGATYTGVENKASVATTADAMNFDTKYDDGIPTTGKVIGATGYLDATACISGSAYTNLTNTLPHCIMKYIVAPQ